MGNMTFQEIIEKIRALSDKEQKILIDVLREGLAEKKKEELNRQFISAANSRVASAGYGSYADFMLDIEA
jgi:hypothetical protein